MPYILTKEEKAELKRQYIENMNALNAQMPENRPDLKLKVDVAAFEKKINDPKQAWFYKKALEIKAREVKKKEIQDRLGNELAHLKDPNKPYELNRVMHTDLIPSDDPEAEAYNRQIITLYFKHPEAMLQKRFQDVLKADFSDCMKMAKCKDLENLMVVYSELNPTLAEDSCSMVAALEDERFRRNMTPEMRQYYRSVCRNFENIIDASNGLKKVNKGYFTVPKSLTQEQDFAIEGGDLSETHPELHRLLLENTAHNQGGDDLVKQFRNYFTKIDQIGVDMKQPGALTKYVFYPPNGNEPVSLSTWINNDREGNPRLQQLPPETVNGIQKMFTVDYTKDPDFKWPEVPAKFRAPSWKAARDRILFKYAMETDTPIHELDNNGLSTIAKNIRGKFFGERMFGTTSHEYKNLIQTMEDFENEKHVAYHNSAPIKIAANQYLAHKGVNSREEAERLSYPEKDRCLLCYDLIDTFQKAEAPEANRPVRWPAIEDESLVSDDDLAPNSNDNVAVEVNMDKSIDPIDNN